MTQETEKYLRIYLSDHLALLTGEIELAKRSQGSNKGNSFGSFLTMYLQTLEEEKRLIKQLAVSKRAGSSVKQVALWGAEKMGRLKLNGKLSSYSELSRVLEVEGLIMAAKARQQFWESVGESGAWTAMDAKSRSAKTEAQIAELKNHHKEAARAAFKS
ncbi:MAG TPA: hypothetical protein VND22_07190 [Actinomycetota bacterium]|nr:hypothetical protein [Actinomycetota bacterium]